MKYSPNLAGNDAAIFTAVMDELRAEGHEVSTIREEEMLAQDYGAYDRVVTMARSMATLTTLMDDLKEKEDVQEKFFNSVRGAVVCMSKSLVALQMLMSDIPQPAFRIGQDKKIIFDATNQKGKTGLRFPLWLKNSEGTATMSVDTLFCQTKKEYMEARKAYQEMGVSTWLVQDHVVVMWWATSSSSTAWRARASSNGAMRARDIRSSVWRRSTDPRRATSSMPDRCRSMRRSWRGRSRCPSMAAMR